MRLIAALLGALLLLGAPRAARAQSTPPADESALGELPITGSTSEHVTKLAVLPSLAPDLEDVVVRSVVRRDLELTGLFDVITDSKAPQGLYGFDDPVDVDAWRAMGAEVIVKVAARKPKDSKSNTVEVYGIAYFLDHGKDPVYQKKLTIDPADVRVTAHRVTDALLGAITGRNGGFASHLTFSARWGKNRRIFTLDADGDNLTPKTDAAHTAIAPTWGPAGQVFYSLSKSYSPFKLLCDGCATQPSLPFKGSIYSVAFNHDHTKMAVAVAESAHSSIYVGAPDGSGMQKVSQGELATHPVFSPSGKLAWLGGGAKHGSQRVYYDGKAVSPAGFTAAAPAFCDTEDGVKLVYAVGVGGNRQDLVMSAENGGGVSRLTQNQGSNSYPACSPDGRMLAFFSTRSNGKGIYVMGLKRWKALKISSQEGESLRWAALP